MGKIFEAFEKTRSGQKTASSPSVNHSVSAMDAAELEADIPEAAKETVHAQVEPSPPAPPAPKADTSNRTALADDYRNPVVDSSKAVSKLVCISAPHSFEAEQFRILRTNLIFPADGKAPRSILVTSAAPGDGKSLVASNLAVTIANHLDTHVLLVDCDIRKPSIHSLFGFSNHSGLTDHFTRQVPLNQLLVRSSIDRLSILPAGPAIHNPSELLSSERMNNLIEEMTRRYSDRIIVFDSPPPNITAETSAIARRVDGVLVVVRFNKTNREMLGDLVEKIGKEKIIGVVGNYLNVKAFSYYSGSKYAHYDSYYGNR